MMAMNSNRAIRGPVTAVPVVAGTGVRFVADTQNNRVVAEVDETVLFESNTAATSGVLSESPANFEKIRVYGNRSGYGTSGANSNLSSYTEVFTRDGVPPSFLIMAALASTNGMFVPHAVYSLSASAFSHADGRILNMAASPTVTLNQTLIGILKIVGVNRKTVA